MCTPPDTFHISSQPTILLHQPVGSGNSSHQTVWQLYHVVGNGEIHTAPSTYVIKKSMPVTAGVRVAIAAKPLLCR